MPYRFIEEEATADVAFYAWNPGLPAIFLDAADAVMAVMIENLEAIEPREVRQIDLRNGQLDLLLFNFLEQVLYYKDSEQLLVRMKAASVTRSVEHWEVQATALGERLDPMRHHQMVDVKAVTLHHFSLTEDGDGWRAHVILDI